MEVDIWECLLGFWVLWFISFWFLFISCLFSSKEKKNNKQQNHQTSMILPACFLNEQNKSECINKKGAYKTYNWITISIFNTSGEQVVQFPLQAWPPCLHLTPGGYNSIENSQTWLGSARRFLYVFQTWTWWFFQEEEKRRATMKRSGCTHQYEGFGLASYSDMKKKTNSS